MSTGNRFCQVLLQILDILSLHSGVIPFLEVSPVEISILGDKSLGSVIIPSGEVPTNRKIDLSRFVNFMKELSPSVIRLNHLGIGFKTRDINSEIRKIKQLAIKNPSIHLYEENSGISHQRWFFFGNKQDWKKTMFEIVITESTKTHDYWNPHFQIDLDTSLSVEEIKNICDKTIHPNFIAWELDVPAIGIVCGMGILGDVNGTKITLCLGTNKRDTKYFRENILKEII